MLLFLSTDYPSKLPEEIPTFISLEIYLSSSILSDRMIGPSSVSTLRSGRLFRGVFLWGKVILIISGEVFMLMSVKWTISSHF